jgi:Mg/Co/Ni transporter MgtE
VTGTGKRRTCRSEENPLLPLVRKYFERDLIATSHNLEMMDEDEAVEALKALPVSLAVQAIKHLQVSYAAALLKNADPELFNAIAAALDPQFAAGILMHLPEDIGESLLKHIPDKTKPQIRELLTYPEETSALAPCQSGHRVSCGSGRGDV